VIVGTSIKIDNDEIETLVQMERRVMVPAGVCVAQMVAGKEEGWAVVDELVSSLESTLAEAVACMRAL